MQPDCGRPMPIVQARSVTTSSPCRAIAAAPPPWSVLTSPVVLPVSPLPGGTMEAMRKFVLRQNVVGMTTPPVLRGVQSLVGMTGTSDVTAAARWGAVLGLTAFWFIGALWLGGVGEVCTVWQGALAVGKWGGVDVGAFVSSACQDSFPLCSSCIGGCPRSATPLGGLHHTAGPVLGEFCHCLLALQPSGPVAVSWSPLPGGRPMRCVFVLTHSLLHGTVVLLWCIYFVFVALPFDAPLLGAVPPLLLFPLNRTL